MKHLVTEILHLSPHERLELLALLGRHNLPLKQDVMALHSASSAVDWALSHGGSEVLRRVASGISDTALRYAKHVDKGPHEVTREGVSGSPFCSYEYAIDVDKCPHEVTRRGVLYDPSWTHAYARDVEGGDYSQLERVFREAYPGVDFNKFLERLS